MHKPNNLPLSLTAQTVGQRYQHVSGLALNDDAIGAFNQQLHSVHPQAPSVQSGQIANLVRWLQTLPPDTAVATIAQRMARAEMLRRMLQDAAWGVSAEFGERARRLLDYVHRVDDLIPDDVPLIGHLDDALMIELAWNEFAGELQDYDDFCHFRDLMQLSGTGTEVRKAWEAACVAEANDVLHRQEIRARGYARPEPLSKPLRVC